MTTIKRLLLLTFTLLCGLIHAQNKTPERTIKFDYDWKFKLGDYPEAGKQDYNDAAWRKLDLPHDWSIEGNFDPKNPMGNDGGYLPAGIGWYRKDFDINNDFKNKKFTIYFEGVYMNAEVFVNGTSLGIRPYGYSSFFYDISPYLKAGKNNIAVKVDNSQQKNCRWYSGSGIYRHVWLTETNLVHIEQWGAAITTPQVSAKQATVKVAVNVQNENNTVQNVLVAVSLFDKKNKKTGSARVPVTINSNSTKQAVLEVVVKTPDLWSPENPDMYRAEISVIQNDIIQDEYPLPFGIRKIAYSAEKGFVLNDKHIHLNGGCVHHDNGPLGAAAYDRAEIKKVELLKAAGFNAVRTSHNPPSEVFLHACDSIGLLVIDETFDGWKEKKNTYDYSLYFDKWWSKDTEALVLRDRNHPSIIIWSIGNEIIERKTLDAVRSAHKQATLIRKLDPTRPVTSALASWDNDWDIFDPLFEMHDIGGYNYMIHKAESDHERVPTRVMLQTESYPRDAFKNWKGVNDHSYIIGDFVWTAMDYLGESGIGRYYYDGDVKGEHYERDLYPWHGAYCGDIDLIGWRKPISYYREILYSNKKMTHLAVKEPNKYYGEIKETLWSVWPTWESWNWPGHEGKNIEVEVYSNYPSVRLYRDGKLVGEKSTTRAEEFKAVFTLSYQPGELKAVGVLNGKELGPKLLKSAGATAKIKLSADKTVLKADGQDLSYIRIDLTDLQGNRDPNAENDLTFNLQGAGTIVGVANANLKDNDPYIANHHKAWKGQALVIVKSSREAGAIKLTVSSQSLQDATIEFVVK
ncbi:sugar-binding domain-containing protein [Flavobacterium psychrotrophum]|uniref:sugar-binding domain-containing protein n=1 Tax=Flavobacterium psychrotrophum TaxID=2294119 RepID=UPI000E31553E|nr:sugar-binding domain-containing protein [Flavobacterium psychrotrophum]